MGNQIQDVEDLLGQGRLLRSGALSDDGSPYGMYLAERLLQVRGRKGKIGTLVPNAVQREYERRRERRNIVLKARQMGMTTWLAGQMFLRTVTQRGVLTVMVAHTQEAAEGIFGIVQRMWENLPQPLREEALGRSRANVGQMVFSKLDSEFRVMSAGDKNAGRGLTIQNLHCSEVAMWPGDAAATLAGLRAALTAGGECCLESTPRGAYGSFYEEWMRAPETGTVRHFFPWWMEGTYVAEAVPSLEMREDERALVLAHGLTAEQIGFRRGLERSYRGLRAQEFAEDAVSCFKATGDCCFDVEAIEARLAEVPRPIEQRRGGALLVWLPPVVGREYVVAADTAGGGADGDYAAVQVIELRSGLQCAELRERLTVLELARVCAALAREYSGAMVAVERNNHGAGVLAYLDASERWGRIYEQDGVAGWLTTAGNKPGMVSRLGMLLTEAAGMWMSRRLLGECRTFVTSGGGRTGAANGAHDDCVMAMAVAQAVRAELLGLRR
jgi:hypothetical protein